MGIVLFHYKSSIIQSAVCIVGSVGSLGLLYAGLRYFGSSSGVTLRQSSGLSAVNSAVGLIAALSPQEINKLVIPNKRHAIVKLRFDKVIFFPFVVDWLSIPLR
jgi:hypothetical protein